jgi:hypothetical protein
MLRLMLLEMLIPVKGQRSFAIELVYARPPFCRGIEDRMWELMLLRVGLRVIMRVLLGLRLRVMLMRVLLLILLLMMMSLRLG